MSDSALQVPTPGSGPLLDMEQEAKSSQTVLRQRVQVYYPQIITTSYTRPGDTTAYTSGDSVANSTSAPVALTFTNAARFAGGGGQIVSAQFVDDSNPGTKPTLELWLFNGSAAPTATNDNAAIAWADADVLNLVGVIEFLSTDVRIGGSPGNSICQGRVGTAYSFNLPFRCSAAIANIFGLVVVRTAYTPANAGVLTFKLQILQE